MSDWKESDWRVVLVGLGEDGGWKVTDLAWNDEGDCFY